MREALQVVLSKSFLLGWGRVSQTSVSSAVELFQHSAVHKSNNTDDDEVEVQENFFSTNVCADSDPDVVRYLTADCTVSLAAVLCIPAETASLSLCVSSDLSSAFLPMQEEPGLDSVSVTSTVFILFSLCGTFCASVLSLVVLGCSVSMRVHYLLF